MRRSMDFPAAAAGPLQRDRRREWRVAQDLEFYCGPGPTRSAGAISGAPRRAWAQLPGLDAALDRADRRDVNGRSERRRYRTASGCRKLPPNVIHDGADGPQQMRVPPVLYYGCRRLRREGSTEEGDPRCAILRNFLP